MFQRFLFSPRKLVEDEAISTLASFFKWVGWIEPNHQRPWCFWSARQSSTVRCTKALLDPEVEGHLTMWCKKDVCRGGLWGAVEKEWTFCWWMLFFGKGDLVRMDWNDWNVFGTPEESIGKKRWHFVEALYEPTVDNVMTNYGGCAYPVSSMYGIFLSTYIWLFFRVSVGKYTQHGWYAMSGCLNNCGPFPMSWDMSKRKSGPPNLQDGILLVKNDRFITIYYSYNDVKGHIIYILYYESRITIMSYHLWFSMCTYILVYILQYHQRQKTIGTHHRRNHSFCRHEARSQPCHWIWLLGKQRNCRPFGCPSKKMSKRSLGCLCFEDRDVECGSHDSDMIL